MTPAKRTLAKGTLFHTQRNAELGGQGIVLSTGSRTKVLRRGVTALKCRWGAIDFSRNALDFGAAQLSFNLNRKHFSTRRCRTSLPSSMDIQATRNIAVQVV